MWIADKWKDFEVLDCGNGEKVERWGKQVLVRPDPQAIWPKQKNVSAWRTADASYHRSSSGGGKWNIKKLPSQWDIHYRELTFHIKPMNFKHTGLFPEQAARQKIIATARKSARNFFMFCFSYKTNLYVKKYIYKFYGKLVPFQSSRKRISPFSMDSTTARERTSMPASRSSFSPGWNAFVIAMPAPQSVAPASSMIF